MGVVDWFGGCWVACLWDCMECHSCLDELVIVAVLGGMVYGVIAMVAVAAASASAVWVPLCLRVFLPLAVGLVHCLLLGRVSAVEEVGSVCTSRLSACTYLLVRCVARLPHVLFSVDLSIACSLVHMFCNLKSLHLCRPRSVDHVFVCRSCGPNPVLAYPHLGRCTLPGPVVFHVLIESTGSIPGWLTRTLSVSFVPVLALLCCIVVRSSSIVRILPIL